MFSHFLEKETDRTPACEKRKIFDADETVFFKRLQKALPNCTIFPHIQLTSVLEARLSNEKRQQLMQQKLQERHLDFGVFDENLELLCLILLEDDAPKDNEEFPTRQLLKSARIKYVRWHRTNLPSYEQILRTLAPFSELDAPKAEPGTEAVGEFRVDQAQLIKGNSHEAFIVAEHNNPNALSIAAIERLTPDQCIKNEYPHIWKKICLFAGDPNYLKSYLDTLFMQNRPTRRLGLPKHVANEVMAIQVQNARFTTKPEEKLNWDKAAIRR
jgi:hypothetical protein